MACVFDKDFPITPDGRYRYGHFQESLAKNVTCDGSMYLRPDDNGSLLPWPYTLLWLVVHTPTVIVRVMRWDKAQILSICLAFMTVVGSTLAYKSTKLKPGGILVWMPVSHILDVGAMMQICCLLIEEHGVTPLKTALLGQANSVLRRVPVILFPKRRASHPSKFEAGS
jgi:hypothetical protein